jgi:hypothetical protein
MEKKRRETADIYSLTISGHFWGNIRLSGKGSHIMYIEFDVGKGEDGFINTRPVHILWTERGKVANSCFDDE